MGNPLFLSLSSFRIAATDTSEITCWTYLASLGDLHCPFGLSSASPRPLYFYRCFYFRSPAPPPVNLAVTSFSISRGYALDQASPHFAGQQLQHLFCSLLLGNYPLPLHAATMSSPKRRIETDVSTPGRLEISSHGPRSR